MHFIWPASPEPLLRDEVRTGLFLTHLRRLPPHFHNQINIHFILSRLHYIAINIIDKTIRYTYITITTTPLISVINPLWFTSSSETIPRTPSNNGALSASKNTDVIQTLCRCTPRRQMEQCSHMSSLNSFFVSELDGGEQRVSRSGRLTADDKSPVTTSVGGRVGTSAGVGVLEKRNIPYRREWNYRDTSANE